MPKVYSTDLLDLIKSLNPVEKAYIKKFAFRNSSKGNQLYLSLFNDIDRQKVYDENKFLKNSKYAKQLPQLKKYLYSAICKALDSYHGESNDRLQLIKLMGLIEILYEKGLKDQCRKIIANAKKIASRLEMHSYLVELLQWERIFLVAAGRESNRQLDEIYEEQQQHLQFSKTTIDYTYMNNKAKALAEKSSSNRTMDKIAEFEKYKDHLLFKSKEIPSTWMAKHQFYEMKAFYYEYIDDLQHCYFYRKESLLLFENNSEKIIQHFKFYLVTLNNYLRILTILKKYEEVEKCLVLCKSIHKYQLNNLNTRYLIFQLHINELHFYLLRGEYEKGVVVLDEIEPRLKQYIGGISKEIAVILFINRAIVYFGTGNFSQTLYWLNQAMLDSSLELRDDIVCFARILNLITHFELGNTEILEHLVKSTYRFLYKREGLHKFETAILHFIKNKLHNVFIKKELTKAFIALKAELEEIVKDPLEQKALESFDFICWLQSKIEDRPFGEVYREKVN